MPAVITQNTQGDVFKRKMSAQIHNEQNRDINSKDGMGNSGRPHCPGARGKREKKVAPKPDLIETVDIVFIVDFLVVAENFKYCT